MKLTHISRKFSRIFKYDLVFRLLIVLLVLISFGTILLNNNKSKGQGNLGANFENKTESTVNSHLKSAIGHLENYHINKDKVELENALGEIGLTLELQPTNPYSLRLLGTLKKQNGQEVEEQIEKTQQVLSARPDYAAAWLRLAVLYQQKGEGELANAALDRAKKLNLD